LFHQDSFGGCAFCFATVKNGKLTVEYHHDAWKQAEVALLQKLPQQIWAENGLDSGSALAPII